MGQFGPAKRLIVNTVQNLVAKDYLTLVGHDFVVWTTVREVPGYFWANYHIIPLLFISGALS